jgi:hypothetical protein
MRLSRDDEQVAPAAADLLAGGIFIDVKTGEKVTCPLASRLGRLPPPFSAWRS